MTMFRALVVGVLLLAGCATTPAAPVARNDLVILVGIDGFRADYIDRGLTPTLAKLAEGGVRAEGMRPSFPSVTFPNHYTLVTGLRPDHHGIVNNTMTDPAFPGATFRLSNREEATNPRWWNAATPVWVSAERAGLRTATMFWPGAEVAIHGVRPTNWLTFDQSMPSMKRTVQLLAWLDKPPAERARFATLYFDIVDTQGHTFGPDAPETNAAMQEVDAALAALLAGLDARGLGARTDIVVSADHGMAPLSDDRQIQLDEMVPPDQIDVQWMSGYQLGLAAKTPEAEAKLIGRQGHLECWRKADIPARFQFGSNPRIPPIFCLPDTGWNIVSAARPSRWVSKGAHGYDHDDPLMRAVFIAHGPSFKPGTRLPVFDNVNVYPLLMNLIGVTPEKNDGDAAVFAPVLR